MGGNGSYSKRAREIPLPKRTHKEDAERIDGHKILANKEKMDHKKTPMNSNSENPIYLCSVVDKITQEVKITTIAIYENHRLVKTIDLDHGIMHEHLWEHKDDGDVGRIRHKISNIHPVESQYLELVGKVEKFNKEKHTWKDQS